MGLTTPTEVPDFFIFPRTVMVVQHGSKPSAELIERTNGIRKPWIDYFSITIGRRASMSANPDQPAVRRSAT